MLGSFSVETLVNASCGFESDIGVTVGRHRFPALIMGQFCILEARSYDSMWMNFLKVVSRTLILYVERIQRTGQYQGMTLMGFLGPRSRPFKGADLANVGGSGVNR
jgi:hypothetical protein